MLVEECSVTGLQQVRIIIKRSITILSHWNIAKKGKARKDGLSSGNGMHCFESLLVHVAENLEGPAFDYIRREVLRIYKNTEEKIEIRSLLTVVSDWRKLTKRKRG